MQAEEPNAGQVEAGYTYGLPPSPEFLAKMEQRRAELRAELAEIEGIKGTIVWEVGCGHGHYLTGYAEQHRAQPCVGVDIKLDRVWRGERKRDRAGLGHLHFVRAEAGLFLDVLPETTRFSSVFVLFPDPWPKTRHHKNRIMQPEFLSRVASRCAAGARLYFRTDYAPYFEDTTAVIAGHADWSLKSGEAWPFELPTIFQQRAESYQSLIAERR